MKLKLAVIFGPYCLGHRQLNFSDPWNDPLGLSGSDFSYIRVAQGLAKAGHEVHLFTFLSGPTVTTWEGCHVHPFHEMPNHDLSSFDAAISWNESAPLEKFPASVKRVVSYQLNSFGQCPVNSDDFVDVWASPSKAHRDMVLASGLMIGTDIDRGTAKPYCPDPAKWTVVPHGCDPWRYDGVQKVSGRVIWASSPDRGLHWLLQEWPKIRRAVPHANLRIFYRLKPWIEWGLNTAIPTDEPSKTQITEQKSRTHYVQEALKRLGPEQGVEVFDAVSRARIDREMAEAEVMPYTCDTVRWTEGFSITLMEACAARTFPITTAIDALPDVYNNVFPMVKPPLKENAGQFTDIVVRALTDPAYKAEVTGRARAFAEQNTWEHIVTKVEAVLRR